MSLILQTHSYERNLKTGDAILFYRTGGKHPGVTTTIGIVEKVHNNITTPEELYAICRKKTFFTEEMLLEFLNRYKGIKLFVVGFLYTYSLRKRPNLARLVDMGIISDVMAVPRGFSRISMDQLQLILKESQSDESIIVD